MLVAASPPQPRHPERNSCFAPRSSYGIEEPALRLRRIIRPVPQVRAPVLGANLGDTLYLNPVAV